MKKTLILAGLGIGIMAVTAVSVAYAAGGNYNAWRTMMGNNGGRANSVVTEKNFDQYTKMHQLLGEGKYDEAQKIRTDLGLGQGRGNGGGGPFGSAQGGCGMMNNANGQGGGCPMHNGGAGQGAGFVDVNNNGICDHAEQITK